MRKRIYETIVNHNKYNQRTPTLEVLVYLRTDSEYTKWTITFRMLLTLCFLQPTMYRQYLQKDWQKAT